MTDHFHVDNGVSYGEVDAHEFHGLAMTDDEVAASVVQQRPAEVPAVGLVASTLGYWLGRALYCVGVRA